MIDKLRNLSVFSDLDDTNLDVLSSFCLIKKMSKDQILFFEGEKAKHLLIVISGEVCVYHTKLNGDESVLGIFADGELFAEAPCINDFAYPASAKCLKESMILQIDYSKFKNDFLKDPMICLKIISALSSKIKALSRVASYNSMSAKERLLEYAKNNDIAKMKKKELALKLNIRPETLSRLLKKRF